MKLLFLGAIAFCAGLIIAFLPATVQRLAEVRFQTFFQGMLKQNPL